MQFIVYCKDKGAGELRAKARARHLQYTIDSIQQPNPFVYGAPLIDAEGKIVGSLFILNVEDRAELDRTLARDPYFQDGIFESIEIHSTRQMVPEPSPGALARELEIQRAKDAGR